MDPFEILWLVFEVVGEILLELLCDCCGGLLDGLGPGGREALWSAFLLFVAGAAAGLVSTFVLPERLLPRPRTAGFSLVLAPVVSGTSMHAWGSYRRERCHPTSALATFWGGAAFALGAALGRFVIVA